MKQVIRILLAFFAHASVLAVDWSDCDWKTAEYKADVTAAGSYETLAELARFPGLSGDYFGQAKAWKRLRELARQGACGHITAHEFLQQREQVYDSFGLPIPDRVHAFARYKTLHKWAGRPAAYPQIACYEDYRERAEEDALLLSEQCAGLLQLACARHKGTPRLRKSAARAAGRPRTQQSLVELLKQLDDDVDAGLHHFAVWFGNSEGGFSSTLEHHLRILLPQVWQDCWHPQWELVGSRSQLTALPGADLDIIAVLNPRPEDAVSFEWSELGEIRDARLHGLKLSSVRIVQLWEAFWRAFDSKAASEHPLDSYRTEYGRESKYRRARSTLQMAGSSADIIPALRCVDGSHLFLGIEGERGSLTYSNAALAARVLQPYMGWEKFPELVKCLKFLFQSEWNQHHPKIGGCVCESLAVLVARERGKAAWEESDFGELLHAALDQLQWHLDSGKNLAPLSSPSGETLRYRDDREMVAHLVAAVERFKAYTHAQLCDKLKAFVHHLPSKPSIGVLPAQRLSFSQDRVFLGSEELRGDHAGIYVMDFDGRFYYREGVHSKHKALAGALTVACAGELGIEGGRLSWISNESGQFRPTRSQLVRALKLLEEQVGALEGIEVRTLVAPGDDVLMPRPLRASYDAQAFLGSGGEAIALSAEGGWTPLHVAVFWDQWKLLAQLPLDSDPLACTDDGWTALDIARHCGRSRWIALLESEEALQN